jgi:hypothetical protein
MKIIGDSLHSSSPIAKEGEGEKLSEKTMIFINAMNY